MAVEYHSLRELVELAEAQEKFVWEIVQQADMIESERTAEQSFAKMHEMYRAMWQADQDYDGARRSASRRAGGDGEKLEQYNASGNNICGPFIGKVMEKAIKMGESNACMRRIVAAPTAGSAGVIPGVFLALKEEKALSDEILLKGLYTAGAVGYLLMRNASVAGAEAGCQAEVGAASAMAAAGVVEMFGGTPKQCLDAGSLALSNLLGLVCDPIAGLVEAPCQNRNSIGATNALICAQQALAGIKALIPFDEMVEAMYHVGRSLPFELRESALGGCAGTKTGCQKTCEIFRKNE